MCTFNFIPKFQRRPASPVQQIFLPYYTLRKFVIFGRKSRSIFGGFFFQKSVLGGPDNTLSNFQVCLCSGLQAKKSFKLASAPYFNKLLPSIFRQVSQHQRAILASTYYTGCVHSILFQNFNVARRRQFSEFFFPYYTLRKFVIFGRKSRSIFGGFFFQKSVPGTPDNTLSNFQVCLSSGLQTKKSLKLASAPYFNKLLPSIFRQVSQHQRAILASTYYTGCVHSILFQNFNVVRRRQFSEFFLPYYTLRKFVIFGRKSRSIFGGFFFQKSVLGSPDNTLSNFQVCLSSVLQTKKSLTLASTPYFNKLLPSIFRQVRRQERAILASTYYTGCVHSISFPNFNVARRRQFSEFFLEYYTLRKFVIFGRKSRSIFVGFFFQKSVLGGPDNTLSNFQVCLCSGLQAKKSFKLASAPYFNKLLPAIFRQVRRHE